MIIQKLIFISKLDRLLYIIKYSTSIILCKSINKNLKKKELKNQKKNLFFN